MQLRPRKRREDMPPAFFAALSPATVAYPAPAIQVFDVPLEDWLRFLPLLCRNIAVVPDPVAEEPQRSLAFRQRGSRDHLSDQIAGTRIAGRTVEFNGLKFRFVHQYARRFLVEFFGCCFA